MQAPEFLFQIANLLKIIEDQTEGHSYKQLADFCQDQTGKIYLLKFVQNAGGVLFNLLYLFINSRSPNWHESCFLILWLKCPPAPALCRRLRMPNRNKSTPIVTRGSVHVRSVFDFNRRR
jgi:hypothetical protein